MAGFDRFTLVECHGNSCGNKHYGHQQKKIVNDGHQSSAQSGISG
jgi:hypothetical protein